MAKAPKIAVKPPTNEIGNGATESQKAPAKMEAKPNSTERILKPIKEKNSATGPRIKVVRNINDTINAREAI